MTSGSEPSNSVERGSKNEWASICLDGDCVPSELGDILARLPCCAQRQVTSQILMEASESLFAAFHRMHSRWTASLCSKRSWRHALLSCASAAANLRCSALVASLAACIRTVASIAGMQLWLGCELELTSQNALSRYAGGSARLGLVWPSPLHLGATGVGWNSATYVT